MSGLKTAALYLRVSNEDGGTSEESVTIENQRQLLMDFLKNHKEFLGWNILEFQDDGYSGTNFNRPGVQKLLAMAGAGKEISCIIVKDFSRFGRNLIEVGNFLDQVFPALGVRFIAVNEHYDSADNLGRTIGLEVSLKAMVYEMYSRDLSKKISSIKACTLQKGRYAGSFSFYGYQKSPHTPSGLQVDPESAAVVKRIFSMAISGVSTKNIALTLNQEGVLPPLSYRRWKNPEEGFQCPTASPLNLWTANGVRGILKDERYTGLMIGKKREVADLALRKTRPLAPAEWIRGAATLEPIISQESYLLAQSLCRKVAKAPTLSPPRELFQGLLKCAYCGKALEKVPCKSPYFRCPTGKILPGAPCAMVKVEKKFLEKALTLSLKNMVECAIERGFGRGQNLENPLEKEVLRLRAEIEKFKLERIFLFEGYCAGRLDEAIFLVKKQGVSREIAAREKRVAALEKSFLEPPAPPPLDLSPQLLRAFVEAIRVDSEGPEIFWRFRSPYPTDFYAHHNSV